MVVKSGFVELPKQTHSGILKFGDVEIECAVLEGGRRVIIAESMKSLTGDRHTRRDRRNKDESVPAMEATFELPESVKPFAGNGLNVPAMTVAFRSSKTGSNGRAIDGYDASIIPDICDAYLNARDAGNLHHSLNHIADRCYRVVRALARVGIVALIDEATGYQKVRPDDDLQGILAREIQRWQLTYLPEFWAQLERLYGYKQSWAVCGQFINDKVYSRFVPGVMDRLRSRNPIQPGGARRYKHHQCLSETLGHPMLRTHLEGVIRLMATSADRQQFEKRMDMFYPCHHESQTLLAIEGGQFNS